MNIGISFIGIGYGARGRDWRRSIDGLQEKLIDPYREAHSVKTYFTSYRHRYQNQLIHAVDPAKCQLFTSSGQSQISTYIKGLELLQGEPLDFIIITRFDIEFKKPIIEWNIDYGKFNVLFREKDFWHGGYEFTTDVIFLFPAKYLQALIDGVYQLRSCPPREFHDMHGTYKNVKTILGDENMHFITDDYHYTHENPIFKLLRGGLE